MNHLYSFTLNLMLLPPSVDATTLALFTAFSVSITQIIKQENPNIQNLFLYLISSGGFVLSALIFAFLPMEWRAFYLMLLGGISVPGSVGLIKEIRREGTTVGITKPEEVNIKNSRTSVVS